VPQDDAESRSFDVLGPRFAGFEDFWRREIEPNLDAQNRKRRQSLAIIGVSLLIGGALGVASFFSTDEMQVINPMLIVPAILVGGIGCGWAARRLADSEGSLLTAIFGYLDLDYSRVAGVFPLDRFRELGILPSYDRSKLEDRVRGQHAGVAFDIAEAYLEEKRTQNTKNGTKTTYVTVFDGLLIRCGFLKPFSTRVLVKRDAGWLAGALSGLFGGGDKVRLEDPRFEEVFEVYSKDQVEARYLLTPLFMERLLALDRRFGGGQMALAFEGQEVWIALRQAGDSFRLGSLWRGYSRASVAAFLKALAELFLLIEEINARGSISSGPRA
jgi:hypothetical protein